MTALSPFMLPKVRSEPLMSEMRNFPFCTLRIASLIPGRQCSGNDTLVGCHLPTIGKGVNTKVTDLSVACGCGVCHDIIDGRDRKSFDYLMDRYPAVVLERMLKGLVETHSILFANGIISVKGGKIV